MSLGYFIHNSRSETSTPLIPCVSNSLNGFQSVNPLLGSLSQSTVTIYLWRGTYEVSVEFISRVNFEDLRKRKPEGVRSFTMVVDGSRSLFL